MFVEGRIETTYPNFQLPVGFDTADEHRLLNQRSILLI